MLERERMMRGTEIVTVLAVDGHGKKAKVKIRNQFGYEEDVTAGDLVPLPDADKYKHYKYAGQE